LCQSNTIVIIMAAKTKINNLIMLGHHFAETRNLTGVLGKFFFKTLLK
jgi:hypothetical protein